jgi:hypothetical protein
MGVIHVPAKPWSEIDDAGVGPITATAPMESTLSPRLFCALSMSIESRMPWKLRKKREAHDEVQALKLKFLDLAVQLDPAPEEFERVLVEAALEEPTDGPARGVVTDILLDWEMVRANPRAAMWMLDQAAAPPDERKRPRRARDAPDE